MKVLTRIWMFLSVSILLLLNLGFSQGEKEYWISFTGPAAQSLKGLPSPDIPTPSGPRFLMKIDVFGRVLITPQAIPESKQYSGSKTVIKDYGSFIYIWLTRHQSNQYFMYRIKIADPTVRQPNIKVLQVTRTVLPANYFPVQATKRTQNNFLLTTTFQETPAGPLWKHLAFRLSDVGAILPGAIDLYSSGAYNPGSTGISADGHIFYRTNVNFAPGGSEQSSVTLRRLNESIKPIGPETKIAKGATIAITNMLSENRRFLIYTSLNVPSGPKLLVVDNGSLKATIPPIPLGMTSGADAIDPYGHFFVGLDGSHQLFYQALDQMGHKSGGPKFLSRLKIEASGIDLAEAF